MMRMRAIVNTQTYNAGFITYVAILSMTFLLLVAFTGLHIGQICESNTMDELHLEEAHYAAERGAHWFVGYCKSGNEWDFNEPLLVVDNKDYTIYIEADRRKDIPRHVISYGKIKSYEISSRIHMYVTVDTNHHMHVVSMKPY